MSENLINIYNLCYNIEVLKKNGKTVKNCSLGSYLGKTLASVGHTQNQAQFFLKEITKGDHKLSRTFYFIKI